MSGDSSVLADLVVVLGVLVVVFLLVLARMRQAWQSTRYADSSPSDSATGRTSDTSPPEGAGGRKSSGVRD
jgi:hypothetical protein